jgi:hypothetical protein
MNKFFLRVLDYKKPALWILVMAAVIIISVIVFGSNSNPDDGLNNAGYEKISSYLKKECINAFSLYYVLTDFIISDYYEEAVDGNIEAIFSYTVIYKNHDRDPDTVQYISETKERGDKNYQKYYDEYSQPQEMNFYFKAVIDENDEITLFSKNPENERQWEETEMSDFVIGKITERHESEKRELYESRENNIAKYISYDYCGRSMYIYGLKIFEEFGTEKFGYINEGGVSITTNESLNENVLEFFISVSTGSLPATGSIVGPDVRFKMDLDTNEIVEKEFTPAPNYAEVAERIPELINPDSIQYSKKVIELSDERLIEIGLYFKEYIMEIEKNK